MKGFTKCANGHYYKEKLATCPYCHAGNKATEIVDPKGEIRLYTENAESNKTRIIRPVAPEQLSNRTVFGEEVIAGVAVILAAIVITSIFIFSGKNTVKMREENGVRYIPMKINGQELDFVFDTGASSICISTLETAILVKSGMFVRANRIISFWRL